MQRSSRQLEGVQAACLLVARLGRYTMSAATPLLGDKRTPRSVRPHSYSTGRQVKSFVITVEAHVSPTSPLALAQRGSTCSDPNY
jgi:hypothetical protein